MKPKRRNELALGAIWFFIAAGLTSCATYRNEYVITYRNEHGSPVDSAIVRDPKEAEYIERLFQGFAGNLHSGSSYSQSLEDGKLFLRLFPDSRSYKSVLEVTVWAALLGSVYDPFYASKVYDFQSEYVRVGYMKEALHLIETNKHKIPDSDYLASLHTVLLRGAWHKEANLLWIETVSHAMTINVKSRGLSWQKNRLKDLDLQISRRHQKWYAETDFARFWRSFHA